MFHKDVKVLTYQLSSRTVALAYIVKADGGRIEVI